jgi:hypothetical protein
MRRPIVTTTIVTTMLGAGLDQRPTGNARVLFWVRGPPKRAEHLDLDGWTRRLRTSTPR